MNTHASEGTQAMESHTRCPNCYRSYAKEAIPDRCTGCGETIQDSLAGLRALFVVMLCMGIVVASLVAVGVMRG